jgi:hypothetical protein
MDLFYHKNAQHTPYSLPDLHDLHFTLESAHDCDVTFGDLEMRR